MGQQLHLSGVQIGCKVVIHCRRAIGEGRTGVAQLTGIGGCKQHVMPVGRQHGAGRIRSFRLKVARRCGMA